MIPIFIITCDRLDFLKKSIWSYHNYIKTPFEVVICDQGSTYEPMREFLKKLESNDTIVYRWKDGLNDSKRINLRRNDNKIREDIQDYFKSHLKSNYVVTDPDILLDNVEGDFLEVLAYLLKAFPQYAITGPIPRVDDIPDYYPYKEKIIADYQRLFNPKKVQTIQYKDRSIRYVIAPIHTVFGMSRENAWWEGGVARAIRIFAPYLAKHLDWYLDPEHLTEDQKYYMEHASTNAHYGSARWIK